MGFCEYEFYILINHSHFSFDQILFFDSREWVKIFISSIAEKVGK